MQILEKIDAPREQLHLRLHIFESSRSNLLDAGLDTGIQADYLRLFDQGGLVKHSMNYGFSSALKLLENEGVTEVKHQPSFLLSNRQPLNFSSATTIPYRLEDYQITGDSPFASTTRRYDYKEVGFRLTIVPTIVGDDAYIDLDLVFDDVVSMEDNLPVTAGKRIKNSFTLKSGETMLLGGIEKTTNTKAATGIPVLRSIPFFGWLFGSRSKTEKFDRFNIAVEFVKVDDVRIN